MKRWILGKIRFLKDEFWWKLDFEKMNFGENWTSKRWIFGENWTSSRWVLGKIRKSRILVTIWVQKDELWWKLDFKLMNFGENWFQKDEVWWKLDFKKVNFVFLLDFKNTKLSCNHKMKFWKSGFAQCVLVWYSKGSSMNAKWPLNKK